jgi:hypothetical protein
LEAALVQAELAEERRERAEREKEYFAELADEIAERSKMSEEKIEEIRAKVLSWWLLRHDTRLFTPSPSACRAAMEKDRGAQDLFSTKKPRLFRGGHSARPHIIQKQDRPRQLFAPERAVLTEVKVVVSCVPTAVIATMITTEMSAAMSRDAARRRFAQTDLPAPRQLPGNEERSPRLPLAKPSAESTGGKKGRDATPMSPTCEIAAGRLRAGLSARLRPKGDGEAFLPCVFSKLLARPSSRFRSRRTGERGCRDGIEGGFGGLRPHSRDDDHNRDEAAMDQAQYRP